MTYTVTWSIDVEARSPSAAVRKARAAQVARGTLATVFDVIGPDGRKLGSFEVLPDRKVVPWRG